MLEGYTEQEVATMIREALKDPERRERLLGLLEELGLLPRNS